MRYSYDDGPSSGKYTLQGIAQGAVSCCDNNDLPSYYVRIMDPIVLVFVKDSLTGRWH